MTEEVVTAREELYELAEALRRYDTDEKKAKALKDKVRKPFLELITEVIEDEIPLAKVSEELIVDDLPPGNIIEERVERWRLANYPEYRVISSGWNDGPRGGCIVVLLEEDPAIRKYSFTHAGYKFGRTYSMIGGGVDVEGLYNSLATHPLDADAQGALTDAITPKQIIVYELDEVKFRSALSDYPELVTYVQDFIDPGNPQVKLTPISKAKEE